MTTSVPFPVTENTEAARAFSFLPELNRESPVWPRGVAPGLPGTRLSAKARGSVRGQPTLQRQTRRPHALAGGGRAPVGQSPPGVPGTPTPTRATYVADRRCPAPGLWDSAHGRRRPAQQAERGAQQRDPGRPAATCGGHLDAEATWAWDAGAPATPVRFRPEETGGRAPEAEPGWAGAGGGAEP